MRHLTDDELSTLLDGAVRGREAEALSRHLAECQPCREALAEMAAQDEALRPALTHDPGDAYFESFASRVESRLRAADLTGAGARSEGLLGRFFRSPRILAWAGAAAVVVVGGGLALMTSREMPRSGMRLDGDASQRIDRTVPGEAPPEAGAKEAAPVAPPSVGLMAGQQRSAPRQEREQPAAQRAGAQGGPPGSDVQLSSPPSSAAPSDLRLASPSRAAEVRRLESGEEAQVQRPQDARVPPSAPAAGVANENKVRKKTQAEPLQKKDESAAGRSADAPQAGAYPFAAPPPSTVGERANAGAEVRLCGEVRDAGGRPIAGAQVVVTDLGRTATTDDLGRFCVSVPGGEHQLSVMAIGYSETRRTVRPEGDASVRVTLAAVPVLEGSGVVAQKRIDTQKSATTQRITEAPSTASPALPGAVALPETTLYVLREAERLEADAAARRSASQFDAAASTWERSLRMLPSKVSARLELDVRRRLATARYQAWEMAPNDRRAQAAAEALNAYVTRAPAGPERTQSTEWLERVRR